MNIMIIGDSWGVPTPYLYNHTENTLKNFGYNVVNFSEYGGSNLQTITKATEYCKKHSVDWIIWFHTEMLREHMSVIMDHPFNLYDIIEKTSIEVYQKFEKLRLKTNAKTIVIGGQSPVLDNFNEYSYSNLLIKDWRSEILNVDLPCQFANRNFYDVISSSNNTISEKEKFEHLQKIKIIKDLMRQSKEFYDSIHPGNEPHLELAKKIHKFIQEN